MKLKYKKKALLVSHLSILPVFVFSMQIHMGPIKVMKYNHIFDVVISADDMGLIEYWCPTTLQFPENRYTKKFC